MRVSGFRFRDFWAYLTGQITKEDFKCRRIQNQSIKSWLKDYEGKQ